MLGLPGGGRMRGKTDLVIEFKNKQGIFYSGQKVEGKVILVTAEPVECQAVRLKLRGAAACRWEKEADDKDGDEETFTAEEVYFDNKATLWGNPPGSTADDIVLDPGNHQFPFSFTLPDNCPTSFEVMNGGAIRYVCSALLDRKGVFALRRARAFSVIGIHDLNEDAKAEKPLNVAHVEDFSSCAAKKMIDTTIKVGKQGIISGEQLPFTLYVDNKSGNRITGMKVRIIQHILIHATGNQSGQKDTKEFVRTRGEKARQGTIDIGPKKQDTWKFTLQIPILPPRLIHCSIFKIDYRMEFELALLKKPFSYTVSAPLIVGTLPLKQDFGKLSGGASHLTEGVQIPADYKNMPPPSFAPAQEVFGKLETGERFMPLYPCYNIHMRSQGAQDHVWKDSGW